MHFKNWVRILKNYLMIVLERREIKTQSVSWMKKEYGKCRDYEMFRVLKKDKSCVIVIGNAKVEGEETKTVKEAYQIL